jgi:hypothetical protein
MYVLNKKNSRLILKVTYLSLISAIYAIYRKHYYLMLVPGGVFITSQLYWRKPLYNSWRRKLDISYVFIALIYQIVKGRNLKNFTMYGILTLISILMYILSNILKQRNRIEESTYAHCLLHIIANCGNIVLYT